MKVKKYRASDRPTALKQVRAELGPDAVIVHEQRVRRGPFGLFGPAEIEVLAAVEERNPLAGGWVAGVTSAAKKSTAAGAAAAGAPLETGTAAAVAGPAGSQADLAPGRDAEWPPPAPHAQRPRHTLVGPSPEGASRLAAILEQYSRKGEPIPPAIIAGLADMIAQAATAQSDTAHRQPGQDTPADQAAPAGASGPVAAETAVPARPYSPAPSPSARLHSPAPSPPGGERRDSSLSSWEERAAGLDVAIAGERAAAHGAGGVEPAVPVNGVSGLPAGMAPFSATMAALRDVQHMLLELQTSVERLTRQSHDARVAGEAPVVQTIYQHLLGKELEPTLVLEIVGRLAEEIGPDHAHQPDQRLVRGRLAELLADRLPAAALSWAEKGPRIVIVIGPTGVGKTTTLAKLAARLALQEAKRVVLVTTDTFRIAAAGQLGTYASIMELPLEVVYTPGDLIAAVARHSEAEYILVDTPGFAPGNEVQVRELAEFIGAVPDALVLLTVAAPTKYRDLLETQQGFGVIPHHGLILTKLDETRAPGPALSLVARVGRPVYYTTAGQNVPSDLAVPTSASLAALLLEGLFARRSGTESDTVHAPASVPAPVETRPVETKPVETKPVEPVRAEGVAVETAPEEAASRDLASTVSVQGEAV